MAGRAIGRGSCWAAAGPAPAGGREEPPALLRKINWRPEHLALVRNGMLDVDTRRAGLAPAGRCSCRELPAGKTGTPNSPKDAGRKHGWMIAFALFERAALRGGHGAG